MNILFWLYKSKANKHGDCPVWVRITINSEREQFSTGITVQTQKWNQTKQKATGRTNDIVAKNEELQIVHERLRETYNKLLAEETSVTAFDVRQAFTCKRTNSPKLLEAYIAHNSELEKLVGITHRKSTLKAFKCNLNILREFILGKLNERDVVLNKLTKKFAKDYSLFMLTDKKHANATVHKNLQRLTKVINYAIQNAWIDRNPLEGFRFKLEKLDIQYLNKDELQAIETKELPIERLARARDYFVFQCYTGLAYIDLKHLTKEQVREGVDGGLWIYGKRVKTGTAYRLPLLPRALQIMKQYDNDTKFVFKIPPNQAMNAYLKEIGTICGIKQDLCTHLARKTFCTTVTLLNGVPMETVSKMVGHSSIRTTESTYAKVLDEKIGNDMKHLRDNSF